MLLPIAVIAPKRGHILRHTCNQYIVCDTIHHCIIALWKFKKVPLQVDWIMVLRCEITFSCQPNCALNQQPSKIESHTFKLSNLYLWLSFAVFNGRKQPKMTIVPTHNCFSLCHLAYWWVVRIHSLSCYWRWYTAAAKCLKCLCCNSWRGSHLVYPLSLSLFSSLLPHFLPPYLPPSLPPSFPPSLPPFLPPSLQFHDASPDLSTFYDCHIEDLRTEVSIPLWGPPFTPHPYSLHANLHPSLFHSYSPYSSPSFFPCLPSPLSLLRSNVRTTTMYWYTPRDLVPWSVCRGCATTWTTQYWYVAPTPSLQCATTDRWGGTVHLNSATSYVPSSLAVFWPFFGRYHSITCLMNITLCPIRFGF